MTRLLAGVLIGAALAVLIAGAVELIVTSRS